MADDAAGSRALRRHLLAAVAAHCARLRRDGLTPPAGLLAFAISASNGQGWTTVDQARSDVDSATMTPLVLDYRQAGALLCRSERTVLRAVAEGRLPAVEVLGCRRIRTADLTAYVEALAPINGTDGSRP